jgi:hypothetical protein
MDTIDRVKITEAKLLHSLRWGDFQRFADLTPEQQTELAGAVSARPDQIRAALQDLGPVAPHQRSRKLVQAYRALSTAEGHQMAREVMGMVGSEADHYEDRETVLLMLACLVPGCLAGLHRTLMEHWEFCPFDLFRDADERVCERQAALVESRPWNLGALRKLAYANSEVVTQIFHRWSQNPPDPDPSFIVEMKGAAKDAGWELTPTGERRLLYHPECFALIPINEAAAEDLPGPVEVVLPHDEECTVCDGPLVTLFDIDLTDPRLSFLAPGWNRLRIATCGRCTGYGEVVTRVDGDGGSHAIEGGVKWHTAPDGGWDLPQRRLVLGPRRRSPYEAQQYVLYLNDYASQLGGFPMWVGQEPHPDCPTCERTMIFVGQLQIDDVFDDGAEGVIYAFLCQNCGIAATTYAQT